MKVLFKHNYHFKNIDSTSAYLLRRRFDLHSFTFVSADFQTNGKGRTNRIWQSEKKKNLLFSVLIKDKKLSDRFSSISIATAIAVINTLEKIGLKNLYLKWPNDVYVGDKKICGILLNSISDNNILNSIIIGVGLNVNQTEFNGDFIYPPTSIKLCTNKDTKINFIKKVLYKEIKTLIKNILKGKNDYIQKAQQIDYLKGKTVYSEINGQKKEITVIGIENDNSLKVICEGKTINLNYGEITFHV